MISTERKPVNICDNINTTVFTTTILLHIIVFLSFLVIKVDITIINNNGDYILKVIGCVEATIQFDYGYIKNINIISNIFIKFFRNVLNINWIRINLSKL